MQIVMVSSSSSRNAGGLLHCVIGLGKALLRKNKIAPVIMGFEDEYTDKDRYLYAPLQLETYTIKGPAGVALTFDLSDKLEALKPDVVHKHGIWLYTSRVTRKYCKKHNVPYLLTTHGMLDPWILSQRKWKKDLGRFLYEDAHIKAANCLHALGQEEYVAIRKAGYTNPVAIIPNGVDLPNEGNVVNDAVLPWQQDNRKSVLFLSRVHPKKGLENLIKAWAMLTDQKKDWKLIIAGEGAQDFQDKLNSMVEEAGLQNDVFFTGVVAGKEKDLTFRNTQAFILPSFSEGMPMAVLEAWSYNLPTLLTKDCNLPEGYEHNAAIKIEANPDSVFNGLNELFSLPEDVRIQMGKNGYELVKNNFTWDIVAGKMNEVYQWIKDDKKGEVPSCVILK